MTADRPRQRRAGAAVRALAAVALAGAVLLALAPGWLRAWQDRVFDAVLTAPDPALPWPLAVVEIGAADETGAPWSRAASARLARALAEAGPRLVAWDLVFAGGCERPETLDLAAAVAAVPTILGMLMARAAAGDPVAPAPPWAVAPDAAATLWTAPWAELPCPVLQRAATGLAALSLPGDADARVRAVPTAVAAGGRLWPGLAPEVWRQAQGGGLAVLTPGQLAVAGQDWPLGAMAMLRLRASPPPVWAARALPAAAILAGDPGARARLAGAVVLVGVVAPQAGGLRPSAASPLHPSVHLAADALATLAGGAAPHRPAWAPWAESAGLAAMALAAALALWRLPALGALAVALALAAGWAGAAAAGVAARGLLMDPALPALGLVAAAGLGLAVQAAASQRAERALRRRMGQILPPSIVADLAADPGLLRLKGERRVITALFTDLEGFSALVAESPPETVIARLEAYFPAVVGAILDHGGMVDKIVGDGVHALFNAPLDQPDHARAALRAARAILDRTEALRRTPQGAGLGRTRIGVETGPAVLGDVGAGLRIDYTAHGVAVNMAARLQEAARDLAVPVAVGPGAAAAVGGAGLRPLGVRPLRSFGPVALATLDDPPAPGAGAGGGGDQ